MKEAIQQAAISAIKNRILNEQRKHPTLDWQEIAARKIYKAIDNNFNPINSQQIKPDTKELEEIKAEWYKTSDYIKTKNVSVDGIWNFFLPHITSKANTTNKTFEESVIKEVKTKIIAHEKELENQFWGTKANTIDTEELSKFKKEFIEMWQIKLPNEYEAKTAWLMIQDFIIANLQPQSKTSKWISVDIEPEFGDKFNVAFEDEEGLCSDSAEWNNLKQRWEHVGLESEFTGIKFYQPLPQPPKI